jgi:hypothetical protein
LAGCCAAAPQVNALIRAPASNRLRDDEQIIMTFSPLVKAVNPCTGKHDAAQAFVSGSF